jgi:large subunit ribosomal protein L10
VVTTDPVLGAKVLTDFAKENDQKPAIKGGIFDGRALDVAQVKQLADMPSREQLLAQLGAAMQAPMSGMLGAMNALFTNFAGALDALKQQKDAA